MSHHDSALPPRVVGEYQISRTVLGKGQFAKVYLAHHIHKGFKVALKVVYLKDNPRPYAEVKELAKLQKGMQHPNIVKLLDQFENDTYLCLVLEYCEGGDMSSALKEEELKRKSRLRSSSSSSSSLPPHVLLDEYTVRRLGKQLLDGLRFLCERNIMHRDLKPANILLTDKDVRKADIRIADLGFARGVSGGDESLLTSRIGTLYYMAPERLRGGAYDFSAEVWAAGLILYEMMYGAHPFPSESPIELFQKVSQSELCFPMDANDDERQRGGVSEAFKDLLRRMCVADPSKRIKLPDALNHPWFTMPVSDPNSPLLMERQVTAAYATAPPPTPPRAEDMQPDDEDDFTPTDAASPSDDPSCGEPMAAAAAASSGKKAVDKDVTAPPQKATVSDAGTSPIAIHRKKDTSTTPGAALPSGFANVSGVLGASDKPSAVPSQSSGDCDVEKPQQQYRDPVKFSVALMHDDEQPTTHLPPALPARKATPSFPPSPSLQPTSATVTPRQLQQPSSTSGSLTRSGGGLLASSHNSASGHPLLRDGSLSGGPAAAAAVAAAAATATTSSNTSFALPAAAAVGTGTSPLPYATRQPMVEMARAVLWAADEVETHPARQMRLYMYAAAVATSFEPKKPSGREPAQFAEECIARAEQKFKIVDMLPLEERLAPPPSVVAIETVLFIIRIILDPYVSASYTYSEIDMLFVAAKTLCEVIVEDPDSDKALSNDARVCETTLEDARVYRRSLLS